MWRLFLAVPLLAHGLAHLSGFFASWTSSDNGYNTQPWLFSSTVHLQSTLGRAFGLLWLVAMFGLAGSALGILFRQAWWPYAAVASSAISLCVIVPWWNTVPLGAKFGAVFDLLVIGIMLSPAKEGLLEIVR